MQVLACLFEYCVLTIHTIQIYRRTHLVGNCNVGIDTSPLSSCTASRAGFVYVAKKTVCTKQTKAFFRITILQSCTNQPADEIGVWCLRIIMLIRTQTTLHFIFYRRRTAKCHHHAKRQGEINWTSWRMHAFRSSC